MVYRFFFSFILAAVTMLGIQANAESGSMAYHSTEMLTQAMNDRHNLCDDLRKNPTCPALLGRMHSQLNLSTASCQITQKALKCDEYIAKNPTLKSQRMHCDPYDVCRTALERTMIQGCGLELKDDGRALMGAISSLWNCGKDWTCIHRHFPKLDRKTAFTILSHANPVVLGATLAWKTGTSLVNGINEDRAKYPQMACLAPELQAEFACHLVLKYGTMLLPVAGTGVAAARAASMALVEESLAVAGGEAAVEAGGVSGGEVAAQAAGKQVVEEGVGAAGKKVAGQAVKRTAPSALNPRPVPKPTAVTDVGQARAASIAARHGQTIAKMKEANFAITDDTVRATKIAKDFPALAKQPGLIDRIVKEVHSGIGNPVRGANGKLKYTAEDIAKKARELKRLGVTDPADRAALIKLGYMGGEKLDFDSIIA